MVPEQQEPKKRQKWGGRQKGTPNKATADVRAAAREHGPAAIATLVSIMQSSENDQARIAASKEILDRAYGKSVQAVELGGEGGAPLVVEIVRFGEKK